MEREHRINLKKKKKKRDHRVKEEKNAGISCQLGFWVVTTYFIIMVLQNWRRLTSFILFRI